MSPTARHPRPTTAVPACDDCDDTGTITDPAPDAPRARPPEPCVSCPPRTLPVTPAERFCATMLRAWKEWSTSENTGTPIAEATSIDATRSLRNRGWIDAFDLTPAGRELLARAEAATPAEPATAIVAFLRAEEARFRRNSKDPAHDAAGRERCANKASVLATVAAYIERGDHLTASIDAPRAEAAERTPEAVLRAMLNSATEAAIEAERRYYLAARNSDEEHTADREVADLSERINSIRGCLAHALTGASPLIPSEWQADYAARLAGTRPLDAPPPEAP